MSDKQMPHNDEAERSTIGSIFLDREAIVPIAGWLKPEHFYTDKHAWVYGAQLACYQSSPPIPPDTTNTAEMLRQRGQMEAVGGVPFLIDLSNAVPTAWHVEYYAKTVENLAKLRRLISVGGKITALGYDTPESDTACDLAEQELFKIREHRSGREYYDLSDVVDEYMTHLGMIEEYGAEALGVPWGYVDLDRLTGGAQKSDLIILAAGPGVGKSAFAMSIAYNLITKRRPVGVFALEMSRMQLLQRLAAQQTGIDSLKLRTGRMTDQERIRLVDALGKLAQMPLAIDDTANLSVNTLRAKARRLVAERGIEFLIVDYLQLMDGSTGKRNENDVAMLSHISRSLKLLARELNIPILALSQLNREGVQGVPQLRHLRGSGSIEQDADVVLFIHREDEGKAELHIAKQRNGPLDQVDLLYDDATTRFRNPAPAYHAPSGY